MEASGEGKSYYAVLGVSPSATDDEIKRAYRQLATTLHPDKVANSQHHDEAATLFTQIQEAYEVGSVYGCLVGWAQRCSWCQCNLQLLYSCGHDAVHGCCAPTAARRLCCFWCRC
jgi:hypothetical protein